MATTDEPLSQIAPLSTACSMMNPARSIMGFAAYQLHSVTMPLTTVRCDTVVKVQDTPAVSHAFFVPAPPPDSSAWPAVP